MTPQNNRARRLTGALILVIIALLAALGITIFSALNTVHHTGILAVSASEPNAAITISQVNHTAAPVGTGGARIRLKPGDYLVSANASGLSATATVHISAQNTTRTNLNLAKSTQKVRSVEDVGFVNMDVLINDGITVTQATDIKQQFFTYDSSAKIVSIDASSVEPGPHNPDSYDPFTLNFTGTIDSKPFRATVSYVGYDRAQLFVYDPQSGAQLYVGPGLPAQ